MRIILEPSVNRLTSKLKKRPRSRRLKDVSRLQYSIKSGYTIRSENSPYIDDPPTGIVYQPDIYEFAIFLAQRGGFKYIIDIGAGSGKKLKKVRKSINIIAIEYEPNLKALSKNLPDAEVIDCNLEHGITDLPEEVLGNSIVISADVVEHLVHPNSYLKDLSKISKIAPYVLISTPDRTRARGPEDFGPPANPAHVREWTIDEFNTLLKSYDMECIIGFSVSNDHNRFKGTILAVSGTEPVFRMPTSLQKVLAIVSVSNQQDIVEHSIKHLLNQGCDVHLIENSSKDGSLKIIKKVARTYKNVTYETAPESSAKNALNLRTKLPPKAKRLVLTSKYKWILSSNSDELILSPWKNITLQQALSYIGSLGYDTIDFTVANFRPTKNDYDGKISPDDFFFDFEFSNLSSSSEDRSGWRNRKNTNLNMSKTFPLKFISKSYPIRSKKQRNEYPLNKFTIDNFYNEYMVELLSGVGINLNSKETKTRR